MYPGHTRSIGSSFSEENKFDFCTLGEKILLDYLRKIRENSFINCTRYILLLLFINLNFKNMIWTHLEGSLKNGAFFIVAQVFTRVLYIFTHILK
jgi:hypothetical protein